MRPVFTTWSTPPSPSNQLYVEGETDTYEVRLAFEYLVGESLTPAESQELILRTARQIWAGP